MAETKFNLFSNILGTVNNPTSNFKPPMQTTGGGITAPIQPNNTILPGLKPQTNAISSKPVQQPIQQKPFTPTPVAKIGTQANASAKNLIQTYLDDDNEDVNNREQIFKMIQNGEDETLIEDAIVNKIGYTGIKPQEQGFIGGALEKTGESFIGGLQRIQQAGEKLATGEYTPGQAFIRGGAGALQTAFSPIAGVLGETIQTGIEKIPQDIKQKVIQEATPTIEGVTEWFNKQSPDQQQRLRDIGVGVEVLSYLVGAGAVKKAVPTIEKAGQQVIKGGKIAGEKTIGKIDNIGKTLEQKGQSFRNTLAGLDEREITALKETPRAEFETMLTQAKKAIGDDYAQTPYHEGAKKANIAFKQLEDNLETSQKARIQTIQNSGISKIDTSKVRTEIVDDLEKTFNVKGVEIKDGKLKYKTTPGRTSLLDETNVKDLEAIKLLEEVSRSKTPLQMMDTIKKMQNLIYDSNILNRTSKDMYNLVKRSIGKLNSTFKEQVGGNYAKILDDMAGDIKLKNDLDKVFKAGLDEVGNRGELAMKRLAKGTTTSSDVRNLALKIKERTGIDLIKEARLRQLVMDLVGDKRGADLFGIIREGPSGIISKALQKGIEMTPFSKEKTALARTNKLLKSNKKSNANTSNTNNTSSNTSNKKTTGTNSGKNPVALIGTNDKLLKAPTITKETIEQKALKTTPKVEQGKLLKTESKTIIEKQLNNLTKDNIDDIAKAITTDTTKLAKVKQIIQEHIAKYGNEFKNYMAELVDKLANYTGTKLNLLGKEGIGVEKTKLLSDDLISEAKKYKSADEFADNITYSDKWEELASKPFRKDYEIAGLKMKYTGNYENNTHGFVNNYKFYKNGKEMGESTIGKDPRTGRINIVGLFLDEAYQGKGLGTNIVKDLIKKFDATGFREGIWADNDAGRFWTRLHNMGLSEGQKGTIPFKQIYDQANKLTTKKLLKPNVSEELKPLIEEANSILPLDKAVKIINAEIPNNIRQGWFLNGDKNYKSKLVDSINSNKNIKNAGLRVMYENYLASTKNPISFKKFLYEPIEMYRGSPSGKFNNDVFSSYSLNKNIAEQFSRTRYGEKVNPKNIDIIKKRPIDTLGSYQTTGEAEVLVVK